jgi:hypothetical protein
LFILVRIYGFIYLFILICIKTLYTYYIILNKSESARKKIDVKMVNGEEQELEVHRQNQDQTLINEISKKLEDLLAQPLNIQNPPASPSSSTTHHSRNQGRLNISISSKSNYQNTMSKTYEIYHVN